MRVDAIQSCLVDLHLDGWLLYDFQGSNTIARRVAGLEKALITRRWFCLIPAKGRVRWLCHRIERSIFESQGGDLAVYTNWTELGEKLREMLAGRSRVAMEYSPQGEIPYLARVDAGTIERIRTMGADVVSSAELVQVMEARWTPEALSCHRRAAAALYEVTQRALAFLSENLASGREVTEFDVQQEMVRHFEQKGLTSNSPPIVAVNERTAEPHYLPSESCHQRIRLGDFLLLDLWAKDPSPGSVYADITWVAFLGERPTRRHCEIFDVVRAARDRGFEWIERCWREGRRLRGFEVDDEVRRVIRDAGYADYFTHRTGHSLGQEDHGNGVNLDNLETHDTRPLIPGLAFSIEPGIYLPEFGIRSEINVYLTERGPEVTTQPVQQAIVCVPSLHHGSKP
ncbi:MAG: aminopeptidase P family protein [Planctomycetes bacterium]|nr:aminopeptidase P family protein [Planctomycetota bacterium]